MFPRRLDDSNAFAIAQALLEGFNRHYRLFRATCRDAKARFEKADWHGQQRAQRERIEFYDKRVEEAAERLQTEFMAATLSRDTWQQVKLHYIGLLTDHHQPELAETFFNSVTTKILHRSYFRNDFIFVRPAVSTEYIEDDAPGALLAGALLGAPYTDAKVGRRVEVIFEKLNDGIRLPQFRLTP